MKRDAQGNHVIPDIPPGTPDCLCCHDTGIVGGVEYEFRYCLCPTGAKMKQADVDSMCDGLEEANETRAKGG